MAKSKARDLAKEAAWRRLLARHANSGQSIRAWCRRHRVKETAFHWWRRELARRDAEQPPSVRRYAEAQATSFVPVQVTDDTAGGGDPQIEIVLPDGRRVRVTGTVNREMLTQVLDVLEPRVC
jgi:hypothetical protein